MTQVLLAAVVTAAWSFPFAAQLEPTWRALGKPSDGAPPGLVWQLRVTPPFPEAWPLPEGGRLISYAYGGAFDAALRDAERISPPFAKVEQPADGAPVITSLRPSLSVAETQGFHPISKQEAELQQSVFDTGPLLRAGKLEAARPGWCAWLSNHGAIVAQVREQHAAFLEALACSRRR